MNYYYFVMRLSQETNSNHRVKLNRKLAACFGSFFSYRDSSRVSND